MADILLGILAIVAGGVMLFAGQFVLRLVLSIWGFFAGFAAGAGLFAELADQSFLGTALGWVSGFVLAVVFAALTYFFYAVAVVLAMAAFGYAIGAGIIVALGIDWTWVAVLVGVAVGVVFGVVALAGNMPMVVLAVVSSLAGAVSVVGGVMLLVGALNSADYAEGGIGTADVGWWWTALAVVLAVVGIVVQSRQLGVVRRSVDEAWYAQSRTA